MAKSKATMDVEVAVRWQDMVADLRRTANAIEAAHAPGAVGRPEMWHQYKGTSPSGLDVSMTIGPTAEPPVYEGNDEAGFHIAYFATTTEDPRPADDSWPDDESNDD